MMKSLLSLLFIFSSLVIHAASDPHAHHSSYAGQEHRPIKSLSAEDLKQLKSGGGWGLAKAAELNGIPGPSHLLQMSDDLDLTPNQIETIKSLFKKMKQRAMQLGEQLIAQESELDTQFKDSTITEETLRSTLADIAKTRMELRYTHLVTHLETPKILSRHQVQHYNNLRGYTHTGSNHQ